MTDRRKFLQFTGSLAGATLAGPALAQAAFPSRPIAVYCAFPAGGPTDLSLRAFAASASRQLKQSVVVENKPGAGGTLAALSLRTARPDGYTLAQTPMGLFRIPYMQKNPTFDPINDFTYVANLTGYTFGLVVRSDSPFKSVKDFVDYAKANPGQLTYGSTGIGTSPHLAVEEFASRAGIQLNHIPYKGSAELMQGLLGGQLMSVSDSTGFAPFVESGRMRILATYGSKRTKRWPDIPTLNELGYETVSDSPFGVGGPKGMDPKAIAVLEETFRKATEDPKVIETLERYDQPVMYMNSADYTAWAKKTLAAEKATIERLGLTGTI